MSGPPPKSPATRQRRNKTTTAARFETDERPRDEAPPLGPHPDDGEVWDQRTEAWWAEVWASPMAMEYLRADTDGLLMLAALVDQFWKSPSSRLASEIRLQRQCYGLTPIDRRRLQWEIVRAEEAERKRPNHMAQPSRSDDPRSALKAI